MNQSLKNGFVTTLAIGSFAFASQVIAEESNEKLQVITSGGFAAAFDLLKPQFEKETGIIIETSRGSSSGGAHDSIPVRLERGEKFDVIILSRSSLDKRTKSSAWKAERGKYNISLSINALDCSLACCTLPFFAIFHRKWSPFGPQIFFSLHTVHSFLLPVCR